MYFKNILRSILLLLFVTVHSSTFADEQGDTADNWIENEINSVQVQAKNLNPKVLRYSLTAYQKAREKGLDSKKILTIIDFSKSSTQRRLWVLDLEKQKVLFNTYVAHGKNSGRLVANSFSNKPHSLKSSLGVFLTQQTYHGHNGYSLKIKGLEKGINDNVLRRHVIFHGSRYVSATYGKIQGMMGRSWGCMAVDKHIIHSLINTIKNKTLVIAYYPDHHWLNSSSFLRKT